MKKAISIVLIGVILVAAAGMALAQQSGGGTKMVDIQNVSKVKIPPAPQKAQPNLQYGNTARAAVIGERLSDAAQGNAKVYISEDGVITGKISLYKDANPLDIAGTMANLTYMLADLYSMTDRANSSIALKVYDTSNKLIIDAFFNNKKNAFDYFKVPAGTKPSQQPAAGTRQTGGTGSVPVQ